MASNKDLKLAEFYEQCKRHGYTDMHDDVQSLKAKVIAADLGLEYGRIADFYKKAEKAYDRVCAEKEQQLKEQEEIQRQRNELAAKRAVNGALLVTMSDSRASSESGTVVRVFLRPDKSIYTTIDNGDKIEGAPTITVTKGGVVKSSYNPSQTYYAGATVGGVTTGGIHQTQESISSSSIKTGTGDIQAKAGDRTITVRQVSMSRKVREAFKRDDEFRRLVTNGDMVCYNAAQTGLYGMSTMMAKASMRAGDIGTQLTQMSLAVDSARLSFEACQERAKLLTRVVSAHFPPSDLDLYNEACSWECSNTSTDLHKALEIFEILGLYKDSAEKAQSIRFRYQALVQEEKEKAVIKKEEDKRRNKIALAIGVPIVVAVIAIFVIMQMVVIPRNNYNRAVALYENGQYSEAIAVFKSLGEYNDSAKRAIAIKEQQIEEQNAAAYAAAERLLESGDYDAAAEAFKKLDLYEDSRAKENEARRRAREEQRAKEYDIAADLLTKGDYEGAAIAFDALGVYKDSKKQAEYARDQHKLSLLRKATIGSTIKFGITNQDNYSKNGDEEIEWIVLAKEEDRILVISKFAIYGLPYHKELRTSTTWEACSLRNSLNSWFYDHTFSEKEKAMILTVTVSADKNPNYPTNPGNATQDKIFVLSIDEANRYFSSDSDRKCHPTTYVAVTQYVYVSSNDFCYWWLRSPGDKADTAAYVDTNGVVRTGGREFSEFDRQGVRPAMWIDIG